MDYMIDLNNLSSSDVIAGATVVLAVVTAILVGVTYYYAKKTSEILKETRKSRKVDYILNQLEKFYTPLITNEQFWNSDYSRFYGARIQVKPSTEKDRLIKEFLDVYRKYKHLSSKNIEGYIDQLERYISGNRPLNVKARYGVDHEPSREKSEEDEGYKADFDKFRDEFKKELKREYERLQQELKDLL